MIKLPLCLTKHHAIKTYWRSGGTAPYILNLGTRREWSALRPGRFTSGTYLIGDWVGPRAGPNAVAKRKYTCPFRKWNPGSPDCSLVNKLKELPRLTHTSRSGPSPDVAEVPARVPWESQPDTSRPATLRKHYERCFIFWVLI